MIAPRLKGCQSLTNQASIKGCQNLQNFVFLELHHAPLILNSWKYNTYSMKFFIEFANYHKPTYRLSWTILTTFTNANALNTSYKQTLIQIQINLKQTLNTNLTSYDLKTPITKWCSHTNNTSRFLTQRATKLIFKESHLYMFIV